MKKKFYSEFAYFFGEAFLAIGTTLMAKADFGVSMVTAPAYLFYLKLSPLNSLITFGRAEYTLQAVLLLLTLICVRRFRVSYLFSFVTAFYFGSMLDGFMALLGGLPQTLPFRLVYYVLGVLVCAFGVSLIFHTYIAPEVYELFVKEVSARYHLNINRLKMAYDCSSCAVGVILSFCFFGFGHFVGIGVGTALCALVNGALIGMFSRLLDKRLDFKDAWPFRGFFTGESSEKA